MEEQNKQIAELNTNLQLLIQKVENHFYQEAKEENGKDKKIDEILEQTKKTNGRVSRLEIWQAQMSAGGKTIKGLWGVGVVFFVAAIFGLFQTYIAYQKLPYLISQEIADQLSILTDSR